MSKKAKSIFLTTALVLGATTLAAVPMILTSCSSDDKSDNNSSSKPEEQKPSAPTPQQPDNKPSEQKPENSPNVPIVPPTQEQTPENGPNVPVTPPTPEKPQTPEENVNQKLEQEVSRFTITEKGNHTNVFASTVNSKTELQKYFNFNEEVGFGYTYTFNSNDNDGTLKVTANISYKTETRNKSFDFSGFLKKSSNTDQENIIPDELINLNGDYKGYNYKVKQDKTIEILKVKYEFASEDNRFETE